MRGDEQDATRRSFAPDRTHRKLRNVKILPGTHVPVWGGNHATEVALRFYGADAPAPGVSAVHVYAAHDFLARLGRARYDDAALAPARVWNHSWIGGRGLPAGVVLRQLDREAERRDWVVVAGVSNGRPNEPLLASAFNVLTVGRSDGGHGHGAARVDALYDAERTRPHLVAPAKTSSVAAATVAGAAAMLIEAARESGRAETSRALAIRAALLAGADRSLPPPADGPAWRGSPAVRAANGLDTRFGAGQLDIHASHAILTAAPAADDAPLADRGLVWVDGFGREGGPRRDVYRLRPARDATLAVALVWPARPAAGTLGPRLTLGLSAGAASEEDDVPTVSDRSLHLWQRVEANKTYELVVGTAESAREGVPYALAWIARKP